MILTFKPGLLDSTLTRSMYVNKRQRRRLRENGEEKTGARCYVTTVLSELQESTRLLPPRRKAKDEAEAEAADEAQEMRPGL